MSSLGLYFGPKFISMVETQGKKVLKSIQINRQLHSMGELGEKVPEEVKIVAILKEELRRNSIQAKQAEVSLSGKDLIIRNFEMPLLSREELETAVNFEAKKYIPFKVEDMVSVFQSRQDRGTRQNLILFAGIKKETLDKYISIFRQLEIKFNVLEYAPFSALRFLRLAGMHDKGVACVVNMDINEENEANFLVLENGFPLFCRDITLSAGPEGVFIPEEAPDEAAAIEKLKNEIRLSLDYYKRKFPLKKIQKISFVSSQEHQAELDIFAKDAGLPAQFIDPFRYLDKDFASSATFIKGYGSALSKVVGTGVNINLLAAKIPPKAVRVKPDALEGLALLKGIKVSPAVLALGALACLGLFFFFSFYRISPLEKEIKDILSKRVTVSSLSPQLSYEMLLNEHDKHKARLGSVKGLVEKDFYATQVLETLPRIIPEGMWLTAFYMKEDRGVREVVIEGATYLADSAKELKSVNDFILALKEDPLFSGNFKDIVLVSVEAKDELGKPLTRFRVSCRTAPRERS